MSTQEYKPRQEVIAFLERALERGSAVTGHKNSNNLVEEVKRGTPLGRELYSAMLTAYEDSVKSR